MFKKFALFAVNAATDHVGGHWREFGRGR